ncbi:FadR/GntR family transcriptional regulator [Frankia sp. R82]|uniref:FadR/GntR family transcriptional regulator n=1 Tax=Frankia sp. R82 TaxID=2950553 RepID=UPI0020439736|nr:GntR family transcriptional regulator [Frankia sp. R82]MCM3883621.1 GntR family transcriptional regulator [Frankia sp. R82]
MVDTRPLAARPSVATARQGSAPLAPPLPVGSSAIGRRVRVPKTAELVAGQLRRRIIRGELTEGDALPPEPTLMAQFGVSRPTLREAFRVLEAEALISVRRGAHGGARVHTPSPAVAARYAGLVLEHRGATLGDVHQASSVLEPPCAAQLARRRSPADVAELRLRLAQEADAAVDCDALAAAQAAFHLAVVQLTGNRSLALVTDMLQHLVEAANTQQAARPADPAPPAHATRAMHARLIELIEAGDATAAADHWRAHLAAPQHAVPGGPADTCVLDLLG